MCLATRPPVSRREAEFLSPCPEKSEGTTEKHLSAEKVYIYGNREDKSARELQRNLFIYFASPSCALLRFTPPSQDHKIERNSIERIFLSHTNFVSLCDLPISGLYTVTFSRCFDLSKIKYERV